MAVKTKRSDRIRLQSEIERNFMIKKLRERSITRINGKAIEDLPYKTLVLELAKSNYRKGAING